MTAPESPPIRRPRGDAPSRIRGHKVVLAFGVVLLIVLALAAALVIAQAPPAPKSPCPPFPATCSDAADQQALAAPGTVVLGSDLATSSQPQQFPGTSWSSTDPSLPFEFFYDPQSWDIDQQGDSWVELDAVLDAGSATLSHSLVVQAFPVTQYTAPDLLDAEVQAVTKDVPDLVADDGPAGTHYYDINGPEIGYEDGSGAGGAGTSTAVAGSYAGTYISTTTEFPVRLSMVVVTEGDVTVLVQIETADPEQIWPPDPTGSTTFHYFSRVLTDDILKNFVWSAQP